MVHMLEVAVLGFISTAFPHLFTWNSGKYCEQVDVTLQKDLWGRLTGFPGVI
jgi:hypothetical protein